MNSELEVPLESKDSSDQLKTTIGTVVSDKADKTVVVLVERKIMMPKYRKYIRMTKKIMAHDEPNTCKIGDVVKISVSRPYSKRKRWRVLSVIKSAQV